MSLDMLWMGIEMHLHTHDQGPITVELKDGLKFTGYYSGECYHGRSESYAVDYELQSKEYRELTDYEFESPKGQRMAQCGKHVFVFHLEDVKTITLHLKSNTSPSS